MIHLLDGSTYQEDRGPVKAPDLPPGCVWNRQAPPEWDAQLQALYPRNDRLSWLELVWYAADPIYSRQGILERYDPVQRWVLFQAVPLTKTPPHFLPFFFGPPPSKDHRIPITREAYELFHTKQCWARPFWVIQGAHGGHKLRFTDTERKILRAEGLRDLPPVAGELPYADFDQRVLEKITLLDQAATWARAQEFDERDLDAEEVDAKRAMRSWLLKWFEGQVDQAVEEAKTYKRPLEIATSHDAPRIDYDAERERILSA